MTTSLKTVMDGLAPERRDSIVSEAGRLHAEYLTLQELRKAKELTQTNLAETLGIKQATIAQMEKRSDLLLSTVRSYVEAMGGSLKIMVEFPDHVPVILEGLGDTEEPAHKARKAGASAHSA